MGERPEIVSNDDIIMPSTLPKINFDRVPFAFEMAISLFENCNLRCKFCFEGLKKKRIDKEYIKTIPEKVVLDMKNDVIRSRATTVNFRMWGGELFYDALPDDMFDLYKWIYDEIIRLMKEHLPNVTVNFYWLSNGVFKKWERVYDLLNYTKALISFSYDPIDRFSNEEQRDILRENVKRFKELNKFGLISITLTKPTMKAYIAGDKFFEELGDNTPIAVNFYTPNPGWEDQILDDEIVYEFYKWGVDNCKFNIPVICSFIKYCIPELRPTVIRHCDCKFSKQFNNDVCTFNCVKRASSLPPEDFYGEYAKDVTENNCCEIKESLGLMKRGCLYCKHYDFCHMTCFISFIHKGYKITSCPISRIYNYIESKPEIIEKFKIWRNKYANNHSLTL